MMKLGKYGVWTFVDGLPAAQAAAFAKELENWGYSALWIPEAVSREAFVSAGWLLANTTKLVVGTAIANIYARDPMAAACAQKALAEQSGGRFLLGLGVSHAPMVSMRGHAYQSPVKTMREYLKAMSQAPYMSVPPAEKPLTMIAALGPKMLELAKTDADGALPYNTTPEHTAQARKILGAGKLLCVEQKVILETNPATARAAGRKFIVHYLSLVNYRNLWKRLGFNEQDFENGGSDRLIDAVFAWGDEKAVRGRLQAHLDAGADHVSIQSVRNDGEMVIDAKGLKVLAPNK
jgi:probable F420-dependent oxidoreductase